MAFERKLWYNDKIGKIMERKSGGNYYEKGVLGSYGNPDGSADE